MTTKLRDLVVLKYCSPGSCYFEAVAPRKVEGLQIDLKNETFDYGGDKGVRFGTRLHHSGVLGVYKRNNLRHLNSIVREVTEEVRDMHD